MNKGIVKYIHILFSSIFFIFIFDHSANGCDTIKINAFLDSVFIHVESLKKEQNTDSVIFVLSLSLGVIENEKCLHHFRVNELYQQLAYAYQLKSNFENAEHNYFKSIEILKQYVGEHDMALARSYNLLGNLYVDMGLYYKSDSVYHVVKSMYSKSLGKDHLWMGWIYHNIGRLRIYQGKLRESLPDLNEALRIKIVNVGQMILMLPGQWYIWVMFMNNLEMYEQQSITHPSHQKFGLAIMVPAVCIMLMLHTI
ncbi:MAG: tetratricopeptide repeat protein [Saprospiraceae bacterium]|nr:tetratricopeptide repeat protein [Saprospiraceae bacterium]